MCVGGCLNLLQRALDPVLFLLVTFRNLAEIRIPPAVGGKIDEGALFLAAWTGFMGLGGMVLIAAHRAFPVSHFTFLSVVC